jgi:sulfate permease, SulP family
MTIPASSPGNHPQNYDSNSSIDSATESSRFRKRLYKHIPALDSLRHYTWKAFGSDFIAGLTVATIAVPQAMAYALLAGLPPQYGLYTAIVMTTVGALLDSSKQLINGPTNAISIALLSALSMIPPKEWISAAIVLAFLVGVIQLGIAFMRLGDLTRYVSHSVIVGFTLGASLLLVLDQTKNLLGLTAQGNPEDHFLERFWLSMTNGGNIHWPTLLVGVGTILIVLGVRQINNFFRKRGARIPIPQHLVAVILMALIVWGFRLHEDQGVKIVGPIPAALPSFELPDLKWDQVRVLAGNAFALAVLGLLEAIAMAKAIATRTHQKLDINQQCLSEGAANLVGSFFQCFPGSGSLTRSAVNQQAGAVTQWSGVFSAIGVALTVLFLAPLAQFIPRASLAGLLMLASFRMVDFRRLGFHLRATRFDAGIVLATALAAILISIEFCIVIGVFLSFVLYVPKAAHVHLTQLVQTPDNRLREKAASDIPCNRLQLFALEGESFFGAEPELEKHLAVIDRSAQGDVRIVILVLKRVRNPDAAFLTLLSNFHRRLQSRDVILLLSGVQRDLNRALTSTGLDNRLDCNCIFCEESNPNVQDAIDFGYKLLGENRCSQCPRRQNGSPASEFLDYVV